MSFRPLSENYVSVATLPANIVPVSSPSKGIERLLKKRQDGHNAAVNFLKLNCQRCNSEIDEEINRESDSLKENLEKIKTKIEIESKLILTSQNEELANLNGQIFQSVLTKVEKYNEERLDAIDVFHENLKGLEKKRSKCFKRFLNQAYKKMEKISHVLPYDLSGYFETEIGKLNEITMNNYRHYLTFCTDLKLQTEEEMRQFELDIVDSKQRYKMAVKMMKTGKLSLKSEDETENISTEMKDPKFSGEFSKKQSKVDEWAAHMRMTLDHLDADATKLMTLYKTAVMKVFNRFFVELDTIAKALLDDEVEETDDDNNKIYQMMIEDMSETSACNAEDLQKLWNSVLEYMETNIQNTYIFLAGSAHLWDGHFSRETEATNFVLKALEFLVNKHDREERNFDNKINSVLDKMREDSKKAKLDQHLAETNRFLDSIAKLYNTQCREEIKTLKKYYVMVDKEVNLLMAEIDRFLGENNKKEIKQRRSSISTVKTDEEVDFMTEEKSEDDQNMCLIPYQIRACQMHVEAVNNWMFGLWEAIKNYMNTCREELKKQADCWIEAIILKLKKRLEVRLANHKPRYLRVKTMIYDVRLKELEDHSKDLKRLEEELNRLVNDSAYFNHTTKEQLFLLVEDYERRIGEIEEGLSQATKSHQVGASMEKLKGMGLETMDRLQGSLKENCDMIDINRKKIEKTIGQFSNSMKLFVEGGDYARDEVKAFKKKLKKLKNKLLKKCEKVGKEYEKNKGEILEKLQEVKEPHLERLNESKAEFEHNERTCSKVKDLQAKIRTFAYDVKYKLHRIDAYIDHFFLTSKTKIWKRKHFEIMKHALNETLEKIQTMSEFLTSNMSDGTDGYLTHLNLLIDGCYKEIETLSKSFYESRDVIINKGKVHETLDEFMKEVRRNFEGFKVQVEVHSLECLQELIRNILKLLKMNDEVYKGLVKKFPNVGTTEVGEENEFEEKLSEESLHMEERKTILEDEKSKADPDAAEIILKNEYRVNILFSLITKLMETVQMKVSAMEMVVKSTDEGQLEEQV